MRRWGRRIGKYVVLPVLAMLIGFAIGALIYREMAQREIAERRAISSPDGIEVLESVSIGGVDQWLSIRGHNRSAPILLYVHGGPGSAMMPFAHAFQDPIEQHFVVVQWDQRGAGKSRSRSSLDGISLDRMVEDVLEVSRYLRERFNRDKIVLLGHSWGSVLGVHAVKRKPEYFAAYVGVGQVVNMHENERVTYQYALDQAKQRKDDTGIAALEALAPYPDSDTDAFMRKIGVQRRWLLKYDGAMRMAKPIRTLAGQLFIAPEYSLADCANWFLGNLDSIDHFGRDLMAVDLRELGTTFDVPVIIVSGTHDYQVPFEIAAPWFETLSAPRKEFLWIPNAAHMPMCSQPEAFATLLERRVLPLALTADRQARPQTAE